MKTIFRFPGSAEYAYAQIETTEGGVNDNRRELHDMDAAFLNMVGNLLAQGCALVTLGPLQPQLIGEQSPQYTPDGAQQPAWASQPPQEAQGYSAPPQQSYAPQGPPQGHQQPQQYAAPPQQYQQPGTPPGQSAPTCQFHAQPATYKPGGISKNTQRPYDAFWACAANDRNCTKASNFPKA